MASPAAPPAFLTRHIDAIEAALRDTLARDTSPLASAARYVMGWEDENGAPASARGKRLRPALCLAATEAFGAPPEDGLPGGVAVELVHNFSLVHDEVQDRDAERHNRPTTWMLLGEAQAINVGDYLYTCAIRSLGEADLPAERRIAALNVLNAAIAAMIHGQWADLSFETTTAVTSNEYLEMIRGKTGALFGAPLAIGAILAGASEADAALVRRWGEHVGLAFQVQDDYLGTWGEPGETGKSNTNDIARRKKSLPVIKGLENADTAPLIGGIFASREAPGEAQVREIIDALDHAGIGAACRSYAEQLATEAADLLDAIPLSEHDRARLREVGDYFVRRSA